MTGLAARFANHAEQLEGTLFRFHGRNPETGLDCIGLAACALERAGVKSDAPSGYLLRNSDISRHLEKILDAGFAPVTGKPLRGDILLVRPGPSQQHLLIALGKHRFVHAHAGLRRVVIQTGLSGWSILHHWRLAAVQE
ncbi:C40 family peptidase [Qipengyuania sp. 1NDH17]|uniref:C40 family peptidase n=1 Tax=Qipengyuania polymorpha TaxID=2867234 RepID=A0ABS7IZA3_9SPHN|nr:NlpC/P60 family protein [Qipengyuania polymorpha]MBX7458902.1 C40 family peptidase [Qipengyuania polymorpha]